MSDRDPQVISDLGALVAHLLAAGWSVVAPRLRDGAIVPGPVANAQEITRGWRDSSSPGHYRLEPGRSDLWFEHTAGPQGWKPWLFPARERLWSARRDVDAFSITEDLPEAGKTAFIGVRACDLSALGVHDRVFGQPGFVEPRYWRRRESALIVAVQCSRSAETCFCASMGTGPRAELGFDVALTELGAAHDGAILLESGSDHGRAVVAAVSDRPASERERLAALAISAGAERMQCRRMPVGIAACLREAGEHPRWDDVAERCLACTNCTMVCPTCFCSDVEDVSDLSGERSERWRVWDSCFNGEFTRLHGGEVRRSTRSRYRQWMTHKLSSWHDQFGSSGCVGCGRCIAWCPVGIDIVAEAVAIAAEPAVSEDERGDS
ncbi:MAG: 4Fe-4S dicluster domain-containing protein [Burkholderiaceae bacterium]